MPETANVLVLDDDPTSRSTLVRSLKASDLQTVAPTGPFPTIEDLTNFVRREGVTHVVSDQRLMERKFCNFLGANALASLHVLKVAPILITAYAQQDMDMEIRPFLAHIPKVIQRRANLNPSILRAALEASAQEVRQGIIPRERQQYRSVITVRDIVVNREINTTQVKLKVGQWSAGRTIGFPLRAFPENIQKAMMIGLMIIGQVNIEAEDLNTLYLKDFELPPQDDYEL